MIDIDAEAVDFCGAAAELVQFSNVANLVAANLSNSQWRPSGFRDVNLRAAQAGGAAFIECDFSGCIWPDGQLHKVLFYRCIMLQYQLTDSDCNHSIFSECTLSKANLQGVNLADAQVNATDTSEILWYQAKVEGLIATPLPIKHLDTEQVVG